MASTARCTRSRSRPRTRSAGKFLTAPAESAAPGVPDERVLVQGAGGRAGAADESGGSIVGLDFDASVAWPIYDWMGVAKAALESVSRYLARDLGSARDPGEPGLRRPAGDGRGARRSRGSSSSPSCGAPQAPLGWDIEDPSPVAERDLLSALGLRARRSAARSSTSTAGSTPSARPPIFRSGPPEGVLYSRSGRWSGG